MVGPESAMSLSPIPVSPGASGGEPKERYEGGRDRCWLELGGAPSPPATPFNPERDCSANEFRESEWSKSRTMYGIGRKSTWFIGVLGRLVEVSLSNDIRLIELIFLK